MYCEDQMAIHILIFNVSFQKLELALNNYIMSVLSKSSCFFNYQRLCDGPDKPASSFDGIEINNCLLDSVSGQLSKTTVISYNDTV